MHAEQGRDLQLHHHRVAGLPARLCGLHPKYEFFGEFLGPVPQRLWNLTYLYIGFLKQVIEGKKLHLKNDEKMLLHVPAHYDVRASAAVTSAIGTIGPIAVAFGKCHLQAVDRSLTLI